MTVGEMITELSKLDKDAIFVISDETDGCTSNIEVTEIKNVRYILGSEFIDTDKAVTVYAKN